MSEENVNQGESTEEQVVVETVTIEQFQELKNQLEETRKAQSGSDRTVTELRKALELKEKEAVESGKTQEQKFADDLQAIKDELESTKTEKQRAINTNLAIQMIGAENDIDVPDEEYLNFLVTNDTEETKSRVAKFIERELQTHLKTMDKIAKTNGRKIERGKSDVKTTADYSDEEVKAMSPKQWEIVKNNSK